MLHTCGSVQFGDEAVFTMSLASYEKAPRV